MSPSTSSASTSTAPSSAPAATGTPITSASSSGAYSFKTTQSDVQHYWDEHQIYAKAKKKNQTPTAPKFYFLDGPPYTSGKVHLGTTWNKILKDLVLRYKRMQGFNVWDRAGYDMHGLPTEHATEKELGIHGRDQIEFYGVERFIESCRSYCVRNMLEMNKVFASLGVWMDFDHAYQSITREFMEGEWWLVKTAHEKGRLYEGERTMTWDAANATALAKHELEYKTVTEPAIYVKFAIAGKPHEYVIIWTTTPWTIPFNLAVMVSPTVTYCKVKVVWNGETQRWIVAKDLLDAFIKDQLHEAYVVEEEMTGDKLEGLTYIHPFAAQNAIYAELKATQPKIHTCILSTEYVDTSAGTGLVHCAPGCGPEDYEVGHRNGIKPFNTISEEGFCKGLVPFENLEAKKDDDEFIRLIDEAGALVHTHKYSHEYPHGERSKAPVIFRTTKQWFLKVEDIKDDLIAQNNTITWVPDAAYNAFNSWLENLRDNSISKQRFWGTPLPIWRNVDDPKDYLVIGSVKELVELAKLDKAPEDLHSPTIDKIIIRQHSKKDGKVHDYKRVVDVLDVWVDAGTTSWNCLDFPARHDLMKEWAPDGADFILEGKDQIRGWFNLLHLAGMIGFGHRAFKAVYMHGFVNDSQGRKMSKSLGNYILPEEVISKYGVDATRSYMIGAANPGFDMSYSLEYVDAKFKNMLVYWNMHKYAVEMCELNDITPLPIAELEKRKLFGPEERYLLSRLNSTVTRMTLALNTYKLNEVPGLIDDFLLDMSRTYIQLVRDKASAGTDDEKLVVASTLFHCIHTGIALLAPITPYFAEKMYLNLKRSFPSVCKEESIHLHSWPKADESFIDEQLEKDFVVAKDLIAAILAARDKAQLGVRWPIADVRVDCTPEQKENLRRAQELIMVQTNIKQLSFDPVDVSFTVSPNTKTIGKDFGKETQVVMKLIEAHERELAQMLKDRKDHAVIDGRTIKESHLDVARRVPDKYQVGEGNLVRAYLDTTRTLELEREGMARELIRRLQQLRKNADLVKSDRITVEVTTGDAMLHDAFIEHQASIAERTGCAKFQLVPTLSQHFTHTSTEKIKNVAFAIGFSVVR